MTRPKPAWWPSNDYIESLSIPFKGIRERLTAFSSAFKGASKSRRDEEMVLTQEEVRVCPYCQTARTPEHFCSRMEAAVREVLAELRRQEAVVFGERE